MLWAPLAGVRADEELYLPTHPENQQQISWNCEAVGDSGQTRVSIRSTTGAVDTKLNMLTLEILNYGNTCENLLKFDDDFNSDGQIDLALSGDFNAPTATKKIILLAPVSLGLISAGSLPLSAERISARTYEAHESTGNSIYTSVYRFREFDQIQVAARREVRFGDLCICGNSLIGEGECTGKGETRIASADSPLCFVTSSNTSESVLVDCSQ